MTDKEKEATSDLLRNVMFFHVVGCVSCLILGFVGGAIYGSRPGKQDSTDETNEEEENKKEEES